MKLYCNTDRKITMRNAVLFAWNSTLKNLISCYRVEKIETLTSGKKSGTPVVYKDALSKINRWLFEYGF